ncbi:MAG: chemotaxis protein CheW [Candidatus Omnitrophica bacterium]|nr:chemotaxis protein CheW [Candidatus Omnitrophota bacterium]
MNWLKKRSGILFLKRRPKAKPMTAKDKQKAKQDAIKIFLKGAEVSLRKLEEKFLQLAQCLREKRDIRADDLKEMSEELRALYAAAVKAELKKTADLARHWETLLEYAREHSAALERRTADLIGAALEALESLVRNLTQGAGESPDIARLIDDIVKAAGKEEGKNKKGASAQPVEIDQTYLGIYLDETEQNITRFNDDLVILEKNPVDPDLINDLFRIIHTIKGSSAMMNISSVKEIAHAMENILVIARENRQAFPEMFPPLFGGIDTISGIVSSLRHKKAVAVDVVSVVEKLKEYAQSSPVEIRRKDDLPGMAAASTSGREILAQALARGEKIYRIMIALEENTPLKGMKATLVEEHLNNRGAVIVMHPRPEEIHDLRRSQVKMGILFALPTGGSAPTQGAAGQAGAREIHGLLLIGGVSVLLIEPVDDKELAELVEKRAVFAPSIPPPKAVAVTPPPAPLASADTEAAAKEKPSTGQPGPLIPFIRIDAQKLDTLMNLSGELVGIRAQYEGLVNQMQKEVFAGKELARVITALRSDFSTLARDLEKQGAPAKHILKELDALREQLERLEHTVGQSHLPSDVRRIDETTGALGKIASYIQTAVMQARMVPIRGVFSRFNRIVRDLAKELEKDVTLALEGEETEFDRNLIDGIAEPLIHIVRNAIDHGIEDRHTRRSAGKPDRGTITLRAFHQGNNVCIEVEDDGKGLDARVLAENAIRKKQVTAEQVNRLSERGKWDLMFLPGFSTAARVTGVSGRGVGMDAVRSMIGAMNGVIDIRSEVGRGTTFTFKIPLTLAIIQALLIAIGEEIYALPLESVVEILTVTPEMIDARDGHGALRIREHVIRSVDLEDVIGIRSASTPGQDTRRAAVLADGARRAGIFVDEFLKETEIIIKPLPHQFAHVKGISGVTILGDGRVALILDPKVILQAA